ncbi:MAG TPA: DNA polymerase I [Microthrixaceae bacterium]|nr:DNA polymerase I [Microthrixaceae bacterium]MCO5304463.1 DNA polymerase I [Microthrixaceae bacterium]HMX65141.1 DNA polymerase I [Microthrixaceae bacterium]HNA37210.1 DNA polymerase I [Microthrixaceae bacterium]HNE37106.1 DNA polymerase I [Microthrixaceae bacterium]
MPTVMLVDGNSLTYRAFFALPTDLATASGQVTNAVFGFTSMLLNLVRDHRPDQVVITFDRPEPTFRHQRLDTYKANRDSAPDILREQMGLVRQVVATLALPVVEMPGWEADDVIATLTDQAVARGDDVVIVTGDRDSYQLVRDPHVKVLYNRRGVSDYVLYDEAGILERTGVRPEQYVHYAALRGDPSDNLPGVPKVGEKTAARLVSTYGDLDGIFAHTAEQTPALRRNLEENEAQARTNAELMALVHDVPLEVGLGDLDQGDIVADDVLQLFGLLEFPSLVPRLAEAWPELFGDGAAAVPDAPVLEAETAVVDTAADAAAALGRLAALPQVAVAAGWVGTPGRSELTGVALVEDSDAGDVVWIPAELLVGAAGAEPGASLGSAVGSVLCGDPAVVGHDVKPLIRSLLGLGLDLTRLTLDTKLAAYLLDPADTAYSLVDLLRRHTGMELAGAESAGDGATQGQLDLDGTAVAESQRVAREALAVARVAAPLIDSLDAHGLTSLNDSIEVPLVRVLARMEHLGVGVDVDVLRALNASLTEECETERAAIVAAAGEEFNVNSTPQLRTVLFERLGLTPQKKTKTGYSTDQATLEKLQGEHPIIDHLVRYREVEKLRSTYGEGLLAEVAADGRIHATFNQTVARTGRLSSDAPNLHNIPVRSEEGRRFREAFVPAAGHELLVADYNQIELRVIAHLAQDPGLIEAFRTGQDIHTTTAARVFDVDPADVTVEQRSKAKMVSYGLAYGMEAYGLGQRLNIPTADAQVILDAYFAAFPSVKEFMERTVAEARDRGYTETVFGRRRRIPELSSGQRNVRMAGERQAMNAPIQGLAADIFKVALVRLDRAIDERGLGSRLILQVHDEVLVEVPDGELDDAVDVVTHAMSGAFDLSVPLAVNLSHGSSWAAAKG